MPNPMIRIHNTKTNEIIDREMDDQEFAQHQIDQAEYAATIADEKTKATARQAILDRLGLTSDEAAILLS